MTTINYAYINALLAEKKRGRIYFLFTNNDLDAMYRTKPAQEKGRKGDRFIFFAEEENKINLPPYYLAILH